MTEDVAAVRDRLDALNVIARYAHCYDESEWDVMVGLFHSDAEFSIVGGSIDGVPSELHGSAAIVAAMRARRERTATSIRRHAVSTIDVVEQSASSLRARSYLLTASVDAGELRLLVSGRYDDLLAPDAAGRWRFRSRRVTVDATPHLDGRPG